VIRNANTVSRWLLAEAIEIVRSSQRGDGRWSLQHRWQGKTYFELERLGAPRRWNTLRALRVLKWWKGGPPSVLVSPVVTFRLSQPSNGYR
jgi:hypothetical protein